MSLFNFPTFSSLSPSPLSLFSPWFIKIYLTSLTFKSNLVLWLSYREVIENLENSLMEEKMSFSSLTKLQFFALSFWQQKLTKEGQGVVCSISLIFSVPEEREWVSFILYWLISVKKEQCQDLDRTISGPLLLITLRWDTQFLPYYLGNCLDNKSLSTS